MPQHRIYLDNAATSWRKPEAVYVAVDDYQRRLGAPAGRSAYREAAEVERLVNGARRAIAQLIGAAEPERIIFTQNGTDALNLSIHGLLRDSDHVVTSVAEHNSVLRPLRQLERDRRITVTRVSVDPEGIVAPNDILNAITMKTRLIALTAASNVTGALQPIVEVGKIAKQAEVFFLVDAAQAVGHVPLAIQDCGADLIAAPGHKGLLGPLGTGFLYVGPGVEAELHSTRQGGTGSRSFEDIQPRELPDKYESGNLNVPGLVGLKSGVEYFLERGVKAVREHEQELTSQLLAGMEKLSGVRVFGPRSLENRVGVVSFTIDGYDPQEAAAVLDANYGIQVRAGLHCAPLMHKAFGTLETGGTIRVSFGPFNTHEDVVALIDALKEMTA